MQKEINLPAPDKDHIILTKYKQAYLTSALTWNLSKHLPEKLSIPRMHQRQQRSHSTSGDSRKLKALPTATHCICGKESEEWRREQGSGENRME